jgi:branched-chain amino acid transport system ATP-binding protein
VLVIEHNMQLIMKLCDRVQVLARGATIAVGSPAQVQSSPAVREAYLGAAVKTEAQHDAGRRNAARPLLAIEHLVVEYGAARALSGVSLSVRDGEFVAVIGPNGAGKSSLLATVAGLVKPRAGAIVFDGESLLAKTAARRVREGVALVPEGRRILGNLTVEENLLVGALVRRADPETPRRLQQVLDRFPLLRERFKGYAGLLSGGEQQQLAIARALMSGPRLLLLDEPSLGLAPMMIDQVYATLTDLRETGLSILLMEQNASRALRVAHRAYVLRHGAIELEGEAAELRTDARFDKAYFGFSTGGEALTH